MRPIAISLIAVLLFTTVAHAGYDIYDNENYKRQRNGSVAMIAGGALMVAGGIVMTQGDADSAPLYGGMLIGIGASVNVGGIILLVKAKRERRERRAAEPRPLNAGDPPASMPIK